MNLLQSAFLRILNMSNKKLKRWVTVLLTFICLFAMIACIANPKGKAVTQAENLEEASGGKAEYAVKNFTDTNDGLPEDKKILTMNDVLSQKDWNHLTLDYFRDYANGKTEEFDDKNALNSYIIYPLQYGNGEYELQVSYMKKDNQIDSILLLKKADSDAILLYSDNPKYKINTDIKAFFKKKVSMSQFLSYKLPESFVDGNYIATLGYGGGNLFLNNLNPPESPGSFAPIEWYYPGGVLYLSDRDDDETSPGFNYYVTFENGRLVRGDLHENHSGYIGEPIILDNLKEQAVIMEVNHDLYTAADISEAEEAGKPIPEEKQSSTVYEIYFARKDSKVAYCIFLNKEYFSLKDAKALAESVKFTEKAFR